MTKAFIRYAPLLILALAWELAARLDREIARRTPQLLRRA